MIENPLLIFDLGNVILRHDNVYWMKQLTGACADPSSAKMVIEDYLTNSPADRGEGTVRDFFETARGDLGFISDYEAFEKLWCCHFTHDVEMEALVAALAAKYPTVLLSNTDDAHWRHIRREYPVLQKLKTLYTSFELRLRKPDPAIYRHVLAAEGYQPQDAIFIDDRLENIAAANALGIYGIHFTGIEALRHELSSLGITT
jgi:putative hydrolase of the HAD superfamily